MTRPLAALLAYAAFVVYGSLVPLDYRPLPLAEAWQRFQAIPFLSLGVASRADWVANGVLYLPLGLLAARVFAARLAGPGLLLAWGLCAGLAVAVEFTQQFFPPRTVSLNDLLAEAVGAALGVAAAPLLQPWLSRLNQALREALRDGGASLVTRALEAYAVLYLALCFFPYDLLLSTAEWQAKLQGDLWAFGLLTPRGGALALLQLGVEAALVAPLGLWWARRSSAAAAAARTGQVWARWAGWAGWAQAALAGAALGVVVELGQLALASGVSQGASVLSRALGVAAGAVWLAPLMAAGLPGLRRWLAPRLPWLLLLYAPVLLFVSGWFKAGWHGLAGAQATWGELRWVPFYYHYYTSEAVALFSLGTVSLMYLPLALLGWARFWPGAASLLAVALAVTVVEGGKLFVPGLHPDPSNVLIALGASAVALRVLGWAASASPATAARGPVPAPTPTPASMAAPRAAPRAAQMPEPLPEPMPEPTPALPAAGPARAVWRSPGLLTVPVALAFALGFPAWAGLLGLLLVVSAVLVWCRPAWAPAIVLAALPVLDLAPWTGRVFWTEFDLLLLVCVGVGMARARPLAAQAAQAGPGERAEALQGGLTPLFLLLGLSLAASAGVAWLEAPTWAAGGLGQAHGGWNGLRILKGALWLWALVWLLRALPGGLPAVLRAVNAGMLLGLGAVVAWVLWERAVFPGWFDFAADYRVTGPFSAMHRGGAFIECYLVTGTAFLLGWAWQTRRLLHRGLALALLAGTAYAVMVTFSRAGYAAFALVLVGTPLLMWASTGRPGAGARAAPRSMPPRPQHRRSRLAWTCASLALAGVVAWPVLSGPFAQQRLATSAADLSVRRAHWADAVQMRQAGAVPAWLGEGLGRFAELHFWRTREPVRAARYQLGADAQGAYLRLGPGATVYVEQVLRPPVGQVLKLSADLRHPSSPPPGPALAVMLCQKSMLTSAACVSATLGAEDTETGRGAGASAGNPESAEAGAWQRFSATLPTAGLTAARAPFGPQIKLALLTPSGNQVLDVARVRLDDARGQPLLANGDFSAGMDRWFWSTDIDPPWHVHSLPVAVWLEQGWLGVLAWAALIMGVLVRGARLVAAGTAAMPQALMAALGFLGVGLLNTLTDEPRFLLLLLLCLWLAAQGAEARGRRLPGPQRPGPGDAPAAHRLTGQPPGAPA